jgi:hypothetical protein
LQAEGPGNVSWSSESLAIDAGKGQPGILLQPGRHVLTATDSATGRRAETWIEVIGL